MRRNRINPIFFSSLKSSKWIEIAHCEHISSDGKLINKTSTAKLWIRHQRDKSYLLVSLLQK